MEPFQLVMVALAVMIGFFAKGVTGIGGPMLAIPVLASFTGVEFAVVVIAIPTLIANSWLLWKTRSSSGAVWWFMAPLLVAGTLGTVGGAWILTRVDEKVASVVLGSIVLAYIVWYLLDLDVHLSRRWARRLAAPVGFAGGALVGSTGISAPVLATYTHALDLPRPAFIFAISVPFWTLGVVQMGSYVAFGAYDVERLLAGLVASIPAFAVMPLATRIGERLSKRAFQLAVLAILAASALRLLWSAI